MGVSGDQRSNKCIAQTPEGGVEVGSKCAFAVLMHKLNAPAMESLAGTGDVPGRRS